MVLEIEVVPVPTWLVLYSYSGDSLDPLEQVDSRGRRLLEAFTAIELQGSGSASGRKWMPHQSQLADFVLTFGPVRADTASGIRVPSSVRKGHGDVMESIGQRVYELSNAAAFADALARHDELELRRRAVALSYRGIADASADDIEDRGRAELARHLSAYLPGLEVFAVVGSDGRFGAAFRPRTLLNVLSWQLLEQIRRRPARSEDEDPDPVFELPQCGYCAGRILGTRLTQGKVNRWHPGCKAAGQARERRRRQRSPEEVLGD